MSTITSNYLSWGYADRLNAVHRLRLLRNTTGEISACTGIQLRNNSFSKKAPFIARCIYSEFCREVDERTGEDLDELMIDYHATSRWFEKIAKTRKSQPEFFREVLRSLLDEEFAASDAANPYREVAESAADLNVPILTLLVLNILPSFQAKGGDVDSNMFIEYLSRLRDYFGPLYSGGQIFEFAPYLTQMYQNAVRRIRSGDLYTRLDLINFTREIYSNLQNNYIPSCLLEANRYCAQNKVHPELEQGVWVEYDCCGRNPVYWVFEPLGNDYIVVRREFDRAIKQITEHRYELTILQNDENLSFQLLRQSEIENMCKGLLVKEQAYMYGLCNVDDYGTPGSIEFSFATNRYDDFPLRMVRTDDNAIAELEATGDWSVVCETGDYEYLSVARAVTMRHVYLERSSRCLESGEREILSWYKIPREGLLLEEDIMETPLVQIRHNNRAYIFFISLNRSYDVTDARSCAAAGVEIADRIDVVVPADED